MVSSRVSSTGGGGFRVTVDPDPKQIAKELGKISRDLRREVGQMHRKFANVPVEEIQRRSKSAPRGQVRIGRYVKPSASTQAITVLGGRGSADWAGQVWGSKRYKRFAPYTGGPYEQTYVIGPVLRDEAFMEGFGEKFAEDIGDLLEKVWSE